MRLELYDPATDRYFVAGQWLTASDALQVRPAPVWPTPLLVAQAQLRAVAQSFSCTES